MVYDLEGAAFINRVNLLKGDVRFFLLSPTQWRNYALSIPLSWKSVKFEDSNKTSIPQKRGIYAFVVSHDNGYFPPHGFIMYIGITGKKGPRRTLRARYGEYIEERLRKKRVKVHYMLNAYKDDLFFWYVPFLDSTIDLEALEKALNDAIVPPVSTADFSAEMRGVVGAFR